MGLTHHLVVAAPNIAFMKQKHMSVRIATQFIDLIVWKVTSAI